MAPESGAGELGGCAVRAYVAAAVLVIAAGLVWVIAAPAGGGVGTWLPLAAGVIVGALVLGAGALRAARILSVRWILAGLVIAVAAAWWWFWARPRPISEINGIDMWYGPIQLGVAVGLLIVSVGLIRRGLRRGS